jgi:hypothetical protein
MSWWAVASDSFRPTVTGWLVITCCIATRCGFNARTDRI